VCTHYYANQRSYPRALENEVTRGVAFIEQSMSLKFGDAKRMPLLVSVRSGARASMPGMMDTILNLGLNDQTVEALARATNNERFAWDCYRRFVQMYGDVVMGVQKRPGEDHEPFETVIHGLKHERYHADIEDPKLTVDDLKELVRRFHALVEERTAHRFPQDPWEQLWGAVGAVFSSWMNDRAIVYRRKYNIPSEWGTAVNVQAMVYGNTGNNSGSGVAFTRDPATGEKIFYGEFLVNAQGEDVVAGVRTPDIEVPLATHTGWNYRAAGSTQALYGIIGSHLPFARTVAERGSDPRPALAERYRSRADYVARVAVVAQRLVEARLLLAEDLERYVARAIAMPHSESG